MNIIQNFENMDIDLYEAINKIFMDYDQDISELLQNFQADQTFITLYITENFIEFAKKYSWILFEKLEIYVLNTMIVLLILGARNNMFGNWNISEYTGIPLVFILT